MSDIWVDVETSEIIKRYSSLIEKYVELAKELASKLDKFGKYRSELQEITVELAKRNVPIDDPQALVELIEEELNKGK